jgi:hypothetical protein
LGEEHLAAWRSSAQQALATAGLALIPYLAVNLGRIWVHDGSFIHFSKVEALVFTACIGLALWLETVAVLLASAALSRNNRWLHLGIAVAAFAAIATAVEPGWWRHFLDPRNDGPGDWTFRLGVIASLLTLAWKRGSQSAACDG